MTASSASDLKSTGLLGPLNLFPREYAKIQFRAILKEIEHSHLKPQFWYKSLHQISETILSLARQHEILALAKEHLGDNILLWGSQLIHQAVGAGHRWHRDVEHEKWPGLTIWIASNNLSVNTTISFITKSNHIHVSPQHLLNEGLNIHDSQVVLKAAQAIEEDCQILTFALREGQYMVWDGPMWHSTTNSSSDIRSALILQFCSSSDVPLIPKVLIFPSSFMTCPLLVF